MTLKPLIQFRLEVSGQSKPNRIDVAGAIPGKVRSSFLSNNKLEPFSDSMKL
jgi:hypothetical protein